MTKHVRDYIVFNPYNKITCTVRAIYTDSSTRTLKPQDRGFKSARARALHTNRR